MSWVVLVTAFLALVAAPVASQEIEPLSFALCKRPEVYKTVEDWRHHFLLDSQPGKHRTHFPFIDGKRIVAGNNSSSPLDPFVFDKHDVMCEACQRLTRLSMYVTPMRIEAGEEQLLDDTDSWISSVCSAIDKQMGVELNILRQQVELQKENKAMPLMVHVLSMFKGIVNEGSRISDLRKIVRLQCEELAAGVIDNEAEGFLKLRSFIHGYASTLENVEALACVAMDCCDPKRGQFYHDSLPMQRAYSLAVTGDELRGRDLSSELRCAVDDKAMRIMVEVSVQRSGGDVLSTSHRPKSLADLANVLQNFLVDAFEVPVIPVSLYNNLKTVSGGGGSQWFQYLMQRLMMKPADVDPSVSKESKLMFSAVEPYQAVLFTSPDGVGSAGDTAALDWTLLAGAGQTIGAAEVNILAELLAFPTTVAARRHVFGDAKRVVDAFREANKNLNPVGMSEIAYVDFVKSWCEAFPATEGMGGPRFLPPLLKITLARVGSRLTISSHFETLLPLSASGSDHVTSFLKFRNAYDRSEPPVTHLPIAVELDLTAVRSESGWLPLSEPGAILAEVLAPKAIIAPFFECLIFDLYVRRNPEAPSMLVPSVCL